MITFVIFLFMGQLFSKIFLLFILLPQLLVAAADSVPKHEYRAVWLTVIENLDWPSTQVKVPSDTLRQQRELVLMLDSLQALGVNTVLLQTRVRGNVIYPSAIEPFTGVLTGVEGKNPGYDALAFAIEECHKRSMQLHAWVVTFPLGKADHVKRMGSQSLPRKKRGLCTFYDGSWYMEPGEPETAVYICNLVAEITEKYNVDGLHLDYVRYPDRTTGYPDGKLYRRYGGSLSLADWRRANVTRIAKMVHDTVKAIKPWVRVSCAPLGKYHDLAAYSSKGWNARETVFQEAQDWLRDGFMDILFPMLYFRGNNFYPFVLDWQENSHGRHIVPGVGVYRLLPEYGGWPATEFSRQLFTTRAAGAAGTALFRARHIYENAASAADIYTAVYRGKALVPPLEWATAPLPAAPSPLSVERVGDSLRIEWQCVAAAENHPAVRYNLYAAFGDSVDVDDTANLLQVNLADTVFVWPCRTGKAVSVAVTAVDAYGRESVAARGSVPAFYNRTTEILLPEPFSWGQRLRVYDLCGKLICEERYSTRVGVRALPHGHYRLVVVDRDGAVLHSEYFKK